MNDDISHNLEICIKLYASFNHRLQFMSNKMDLGIMFDSNLTFELHSTGVNKANSLLRLIKRASTYLDSCTLVQFYKVLIQPHIESFYCDWAPHKKHVDLIGGRRRGTDSISYLCKLTYQKTLEVLWLPTLNYCRTKGNMVKVLKLFQTFPTIKLHKPVQLVKTCESNRTRFKKELKFHRDILILILHTTFL